VTLLVLGAGGQVGRALVQLAGNNALGLDRVACDITDAGSVARVMSGRGLSVVVNCAGFTAVDRAESERSRAFAVNMEGAAIVARAAYLHGLPMIHISSDYVFDGMHDGGYREEDPIAPLNVYGASKAAGDAAVGAANPMHLLLRVSWVFGIHGANFVKTVLRLGREQSELRVVDDQRGRPTEASDIAGAILTMAAACRQPDFNAWGTYHFAGTPSTTRYGFARAIFDRMHGRPPRLVPIVSEEHPTPARRPLNATLCCAKIHRTFAIDQPDWRISLSRVLAVIDSAPRVKSPPLARNRP
jgi:dTDP-4-dehydrorhamnose reductase